MGLIMQILGVKMSKKIFFTKFIFHYDIIVTKSYYKNGSPNVEHLYFVEQPTV